MSSSISQTRDYRSRFKTYQSIACQKDALFEELVKELDNVTLQLESMKNDSEKVISTLQADLESEKDSRRGWQDKASVFGERLVAIDQARFILVLIDADADVYMFRDEFLSRGLLGGQALADKFVEKVREYLDSLGSSIKDAKTIPIVIKAYANLNGLAQSCVRDKKLENANQMSQFWIGFTRQYPLVDFIDVGSGKEEADNKLREVLGFNIANPQCQHVMLACCHDAGYIPVLRQYAAQKSSSDRITLLSSGTIRSDMMTLGFRTTSLFVPLFNSKTSSHASSSSSSFPSYRGKNIQQYTTTTSSSSNTTSGKSRTSSTSSSKSSNPPHQQEKLVPNIGRLRPIIRNALGKRIDKPLNCNESLCEAMKRRDLCFIHYLRSDCVVEGCDHHHDYPRPLKPVEYDALWVVARRGRCHRSRRGGNCEDELCIYGHVTV